MSENIKIPRILREPEGPSIKDQIHDRFTSSIETAGNFRRRMSSEMARTVMNISFDKSSVFIADYDPNNPKKYEQDMNFASYEPNLEEDHYQEKIRPFKDIGSLAMVLTGMDLVGGMRRDKKASRIRDKERREAYIRRNGTTRSRLRDRYVEQRQRLDK